MRKLIVICVTVVLTFGIASLYAAQRAEGVYNGGDKSENSFARVVKTPFRAVKNLFGFGRKKTRFERLTKKDIEKFEPASFTRIEYNRTTDSLSSVSEVTVQDYITHGRELLSKGDPNGAVAELSRAVALDKKSGEAYNLLGIAYDRAGNTERAKKAFERSLRHGGKNAQTLNNLGFLLYRKGDFREAVERYEQALKFTPNDGRLLNNLAMAYFRLGDEVEAFDHFRRAGGEFNAHYNFAVMLEQAGLRAEALTHYKSAFDLNPTSPLVAKRFRKDKDAGETKAAVVETTTTTSAPTTGAAPVVAAGGTSQQQ